MTLNGWLQILLFLGAVALVTVPLGRFMTAVFARERTWLDPVLRPLERLIYRLTRVDDSREMALDGIRRVDAGLQPGVDAGALRPAAPAGPAAVQSAGPAGRRAGSGLQHRRLVHDQHQLAVVRRRDDDELLHADGRPRVPELRVGGRRHRAGDRLHPRHRRARARDARQLLGGHDARHALGAAAVLPGRVAAAGVAGGRAELQALRPRAARRSPDHDHD